MEAGDGGHHHHGRLGICCRVVFSWLVPGNHVQDMVLPENERHGLDRLCEEKQATV
jgi:hypothetical protein